MNIAKIDKILQENIDEKYRDFSFKLLPDDTKILGVRLPFLRKLAKQIVREDWKSFLVNYKSNYLEERLLLGFVIAYIPINFTEKIELIKRFVPLINNWSICDSFCVSFKLARDEKTLLWQFIQPYFFKQGEYERRFAIVMGLNHLIEDEFVDKFIEKLVIIDSKEYYAQMAVAWALAEVYIYYPQKVENLLNNKILNIGSHNRTIQKINESLRVDKTVKNKLKKLRRLK